MPTITLRDAFNERRNNFQLTYEWQGVRSALQLLTHAGEIVAAIYGESAGARVAAEILSIADAAESEGNEDWRESLASIDPCQTHSPFFEDIHELTAFARFGILTIWNDPSSATDAFKIGQDISVAVTGLCERITNLLDLIPDGPKKAPELAALRDMSLARLAYDSGAPLTVHQLAALSEVSVKRVQNAVYADKKAPMIDSENRVTREGCERWLADRDYHPSIWQHVERLGKLDDDWGRNIVLESVEDNGLHEDYLFVPVADDGSVFSPALKRDRAQHYTIGAKGAEETISDFDEALSKLSRMAVPYWRRPNQNGNWGIVSGQSWKRIRKAELEKLAR